MFLINEWINLEPVCHSAFLHSCDLCSKWCTAIISTDIRAAVCCYFPNTPTVQILCHDLWLWLSCCRFESVKGVFFFFTDRVDLFWAHHGGVCFWSVMLHLICSDKVTCGSGYCGFTFDFLCSDLSSDIMSGLTICVDDGTWFWLEPPQISLKIYGICLLAIHPCRFRTYGSFFN